MRTKITDNFYLDEITSISEKNLLPSQMYLINYICKYLMQPIRDRLGLPIKITSGMRTQADIVRLRKAGYHPSTTSDHFFGRPQEIPYTTIANRAKIKKYGRIYTFSVGALDFEIGDDNSRMPYYFDQIVKMSNEGFIDPGQLILEKGKYTYWIHISNPRTCVYDYAFMESVGMVREDYQCLTSLLNDGKYKIYTPN